MKNKIKHLMGNPFFPPGLLLFFFLLSFLWISFYGQGRRRVVYYFPENQGGGFDAEIRILPRHEKNQDKSLRLFLDELLLGPVSLPLTDAVPPGTRINHLILQGKTLYVDFSQEFLEAETTMPVSFQQAAANIKRNLEFNYPRLDKVALSVEGQVFGATYFAIPSPKKAKLFF